MRSSFLIIILIFLPLAVLATSSDAQIKQILIQQSMTNYLASIGNCPCPYNQDKAGRLCGKRSAWSKAGGYSPLCYPSDITPDMILKYKQNEASTPAMNYFDGGDEGPMIKPGMKQNE